MTFVEIHNATFGDHLTHSRLLKLARMTHQASLRDTCWTAEVYPPSDDSFALVDAVATRLRAKRILPTLCLEVGTGSGYVSTSLALLLKSWGHTAFQILATDLHPDATQCAIQTVRNHGVEAHVEILLTSFWDGISPVAPFDLILFNPPYVPTPLSELDRGGLCAAWAGGEKGRHIIDAFLHRVVPLLRVSDVEILLVTIEENDPAEVMASVQQQGFFAECVLKRTADQETLSILSLRSRRAL